MSLKSKWERGHFESARAYRWLFINGRMLVINDSAVYKPVKKRHKIKNAFYNGTKIVKDKENIK